MLMCEVPRAHVLTCDVADVLMCDVLMCDVRRATCCIRLSVRLSSQP